MGGREEAAEANRTERKNQIPSCIVRFVTLSAAPNSKSRIAVRGSSYGAWTRVDGDRLIVGGRGNGCRTAAGVSRRWLRWVVGLGSANVFTGITRGTDGGAGRRTDGGAGTAHFRIGRRTSADEGAARRIARTHSARQPPRGTRDQRVHDPVHPRALRVVHAGRVPAP